MDSGQLPRVMLVSDAPLSRNGLGIDRTLYSLFERYPPERFLLYTRGRSGCTPEEQETFIHRAVSFPDRYVPQIFTHLRYNRIANLIRSGIALLEDNCRAYAPIKHLHRIKEFDPEVIVICPNGPVDLLEGCKVAKHFRCPKIMYLMDDWPAIVTKRWLLDDIQSVVGHALRDADGWIMISEALTNELAVRYHAEQKRTLIAHNTVAIEAYEEPSFSVRAGTFRIGYAGSIWSMHEDAIALVAEGVSLLRNEGIDIEFVIYCPEHFWIRHAAWLGSRGVTFGGFVQHRDLTTVLQQCDLLLVASSFSPKWAGHARASVQTKLTDYMSTGRPILSVGPTGCACHEFLHRWQCGLTSAAASAQEMARDLRRALHSRAANMVFARRAFAVAREHFNQQTVTDSLHKFLIGVAGQS